MAGQLPAAVQPMERDSRLVVAALLGAAAATASCATLFALHRRRQSHAAPVCARASPLSASAHQLSMRPPQVGDGVLAAIGNTPLVRIASLSRATGCEARARLAFPPPDSLTLLTADLRQG